MSLTLMFLQLAVILLVARLVGLLMRRMGQPQVIGEILAGIALGPSLLGLMAPTVQHALFPAESVGLLKNLSSLGLVLFMFLVGLELDLQQIQKMYRKAINISIGGMVLPLLLGIGAGAFLMSYPEYLAASQTPLVGVLFLGVALSVTAFPVLARILSEFGMTRTRLGALALASAAIDDVVAWLLLAGVLVLARGNSEHAVVQGAGTMVFLLVCSLVLRPMLRWLADFLSQKQATDWALPIWMVLLFLCASATEYLEMHYVMGAFLFGMISPRGWVVQAMEQRIAPLTTQLMLPIFFVISGLNTQLNLLSSISGWLVALLMIFLASAGKLVGCGWLAWRSGESRGDALALAGLMNARGLMELVMLNIGLQMGLIGPLLFSIMVLMAVVTTMLATPIFQLGMRWSGQQMGETSAKTPQ
ncbi:cation:proton antiporter domain-containing protein [Deinococcus roseus]|uniref:Cation/H+ exchanger transmembrane domain-containing protein n=1 Tax=Deinococcus roseus TaxID=392414 RepID=A0ABQ2CX31_9DEIO|nr:cation:proton antiporter [Deinococcus roseus]GGJ29390.1 hypothetical protein GCM10008938_14390 [Deinococcus roseus]